MEGRAGQTLRARIWHGLTDAGAIEKTLSEHRAIADAVISGDAELARALATAHVAGVETWLERATRAARTPAARRA